MRGACRPVRDKAPFRIAGNEDYAVLGDVVTGYGQKVVGLPEAKTSGLVMCSGWFWFHGALLRMPDGRDCREH